MSARGYIPKDVQIAALLLTIMVEEDGKLVPFIDHETAQKLTPDQIISLFHRDHYPIRKESGGPDAPWNLVFRPIMEHRIKTAKVDIPEIRKGYRIREDEAEHRRKMLAKGGMEDEAPPSPSKRKSRPMDGSRNSPWRKPMNGKAERR